MRQPIWRLAIRTKFNDVRYWHLADVRAALTNVCFRGVKQTSQSKGVKSAYDPKRTSAKIFPGPPGIGTAMNVHVASPMLSASDQCGPAVTAARDSGPIGTLRARELWK